MQQNIEDSEALTTKKNLKLDFLLSLKVYIRQKIP